MAKESKYDPIYPARLQSCRGAEVLEHFAGNAVHPETFLVRYEGGLLYKGVMRNGEREGYGTLSWLEEGDNPSERKGLFARTCQYEGFWHHNKPHGEGTLSDSKLGILYQGHWKEGARSGQGEGLFMTNDEVIMRYKGEWKDGLPHGIGTATYPDGTIKKSCWADGNPVPLPQDRSANIRLAGLRDWMHSLHCYSVSSTGDRDTEDIIAGNHVSRGWTSLVRREAPSVDGMLR